LEAGHARALDGGDGDVPASRVSELVMAELARDGDGALGHDLRQAKLGAQRAHALAHDRDRSLVEDDLRVPPLEPPFDQNGAHLTKTIVVPRPGAESRANSSTSRLLPESPRPIDLEVLWPPASTRATSAIPGPSSRNVARTP